MSHWSSDRTELNGLSEQEPERFEQMKSRWQTMADTMGVNQRGQGKGKRTPQR